jgi:hypothetical protein
MEKESNRVFGLTDCEVTEALRTDCKLSDVSVCLAQETGDVGDFGSEGFAVFESPGVDGPAGNWAAAIQSLPAVIDEGDGGGGDEGDDDFDDFETADIHCASMSCVGMDDGKVSITYMCSCTSRFQVVFY